MNPAHCVHERVQLTKDVRLLLVVLLASSYLLDELVMRLVLQTVAYSFHSPKFMVATPPAMQDRRKFIVFYVSLFLYGAIMHASFLALPSPGRHEYSYGQVFPEIIGVRRGGVAQLWVLDVLMLFLQLFNMDLAYSVADGLSNQSQSGETERSDERLPSDDSAVNPAIELNEHNENEGSTQVENEPLLAPDNPANVLTALDSTRLGFPVGSLNLGGTVVAEFDLWHSLRDHWNYVPPLDPERNPDQGAPAEFPITAAFV